MACSLTPAAGAGAGDGKDRVRNRSGRPSRQDLELRRPELSPPTTTSDTRRLTLTAAASSASTLWLGSKTAVGMALSAASKLRLKSYGLLGSSAVATMLSLAYLFGGLASLEPVMDDEASLKQVRSVSCL
jgi:hypothetical protein